MTKTMNRNIEAGRGQLAHRAYRPTLRGVLAVAACALIVTAGLWLRSLAHVDAFIIRAGPYTLKVIVAGGGVRVGVVPDQDYKAGWHSLRGGRPVYPFVDIPDDRLRRWLGCDVQLLRGPQWPPEAAVVFPIAALAAVPALSAAGFAWRRRRRHAFAPRFSLIPSTPARRRAS